MVNGCHGIIGDSSCRTVIRRWRLPNASSRASVLSTIAASSRWRRLAASVPADTRSPEDLPSSHAADSCIMRPLRRSNALRVLPMAALMRQMSSGLAFTSGWAERRGRALGEGVCRSCPVTYSRWSIDASSDALSAHSSCTQRRVKTVPYATHVWDCDGGTPAAWPYLVAVRIARRLASTSLR